MKRTLFRYMSERYANALVHRGEVLFRALSYFRDYEDEWVRRDEFEGTRVHSPSGGLTVTKVATGEVISLPHAFESTANEKDIFVYCLSHDLDPSVAKRFRTEVCVEIVDFAAFLAKIRSALERRPSIRNKHIEHGSVKYYQPDEPPIIDWALPERIALSKLSSFSWQREYRLAFGVNGAFKVENVQVRLRAGPRQVQPSIDHPKKMLKVGDLTKLCKIHQV